MSTTTEEESIYCMTSANIHRGAPILVYGLYQHPNPQYNHSDLCHGVAVSFSSVFSGGFARIRRYSFCKRTNATRYEVGSIPDLLCGNICLRLVY